MGKWKFMETDGRPTEKGVYWVVLLYDEYLGKEKSGRKIAEIDTRFLGDAEDFSMWKMTDEPQTGLAWMEEIGSHFEERVHAWMEMEVPPMPDIPEGYIPKE